MKLNYKKIYTGIMTPQAFSQKWKEEILKRNFVKGEEEEARRYLIALKYDVFSLLESKKKGV